MENLEKILARIVEDADARSMAILEKADEQCAALNLEADEKIEKIVEEAKVKSQKADCDIMTRAKSSSAMAKREALLKAKVDTINRAYKMAEESLYSLPDEQYRELLAQLLAEGVSLSDAQNRINEELNLKLISLNKKLKLHNLH